MKDLAGKFLEYVMNNHLVNREPETILQAFQISLVRPLFAFIFLNSLCNWTRMSFIC